MLVLFALFLVVLLGIAAVTVDYGHWLEEKRNLQNAADEAATAGVSELLRRPITAGKQVSAAEHALLYVDARLALGIKANGQLNCAAAAASDPAGNGFGPEDCLNYTGTTRVRIRTPVGSGDSCTGSGWGNRAVTVRIERPSARYFSRIYDSADPIVGTCATAAVQGGGLAVAVLKPNQTAPGVYTVQPNNSTITIKLAGQNSYVRIWNGDVGINSLFSAAGAPPPTSPNEPAYVKFMSADGAGVSENRVYMTIDAPSPMTWDVGAKQIRTEGLSSIEGDDLYHEPRHLATYIPIPGWGNALYAGIGDGAETPVDIAQGTVLGVGVPGTGTCTDPVTGEPGVDPGKYSRIATGTVTRRWLCPGVYHVVGSGSQDGLQLGSDTMIAGQGVTLVFENDSHLDLRSGAALLLNCVTSGKPECANPTPAPWTTGDARHEVPISIWIEPVSGCDPLAAACANPSAVFTVSSGGGLDIRGIIYGPTDEMKIAGNGLHHGTGEIWAWTIEYKGNSTLDQYYEGGDDGWPLLVE